MVSAQIKVVTLRMGSRPKVEMVDSGLSSMQAFVEGLTPCVQLDGDHSGGCDLWCNDKGLYTGKPNRHVKAGSYSQVVYGPMFIAAHDDEGNTVSLTDEQCEKWMEQAAEWPRAMTSLADGEKGEPGELLLIM